MTPEQVPSLLMAPRAPPRVDNPGQQLFLRLPTPLILPIRLVY